MCAICLRAVRFLPQLKFEDWEKFIDFMFFDNIVVKLMATETWLAITSNPNIDKAINSELIQERIISILKSESLPDRRLLKNYILILGRLDPCKVSNLLLNYRSDPLISNAFDVIMNGKVSNLFLEIEPEIIRQKYYSGKNRYLGEGDAEQIS
jgi:hypothetical protein